MRIKKLSELNIQIIDGDRGVNYPKEKDFMERGFCLFLNAKNVTKNGFRFNTCQFVNEDKDLILGNGKLERHDIVLTTRGTVGNFAFYDDKVPYKNIRINSGMVILRNQDNEIENSYLQHLFSSTSFHDQIDRISFGSAQPQLTVKTINGLEISYPSLRDTQRRIALILSTCDTVIEKTEAAIAKYKAIKQGMLHDLFTRGIDLNTGKLRPKYEDAPEFYKESKLGMVPKEWEVNQIKEVIDPIMSNVDKHIKEDETKILLCNYMNVYINRYLIKDIPFSQGSVDSSEMQRFSLRFQDVIITKDSETPDDIAVPSIVCDEIEKLICGYHLCILRSRNQENLEGVFLMLQLQMPEVNSQFAIRANGSTRYGLTIDVIENVYLKVPQNISEQKEISKGLRTIDQKIQTEQSYLYKLQSIKQGLMSDLLSGKKLVTGKEGQTA